MSVFTERCISSNNYKVCKLVNMVHCLQKIQVIRNSFLIQTEYSQMLLILAILNEFQTKTFLNSVFKVIDFD